MHPIGRAPLGARVDPFGVGEQCVGRAENRGRRRSSGGWPAPVRQHPPQRFLGEDRVVIGEQHGGRCRRRLEHPARSRRAQFNGDDPIGRVLVTQAGEGGSWRACRPGRPRSPAARSPSGRSTGLVERVASSDVCMTTVTGGSSIAVSVVHVTERTARPRTIGPSASRGSRSSSTRRPPDGTARSALQTQWAALDRERDGLAEHGVPEEAGRPGPTGRYRMPRTMPSSSGPTPWTARESPGVVGAGSAEGRGWPCSGRMEAGRVVIVPRGFDEPTSGSWRPEISYHGTQCVRSRLRDQATVTSCRRALGR